MATVADVARQVLAAVDTTAGHLLAASWVVERYHEFCARVKARHLRRVSTVTIPAPLSAGTVAITNGSVLVTPDEDALAEWNAVPQGVLGRHLRVATNWYEVVGRNGDTLVLRSPVAEDTTPAITYQMVARYVPLASDVRWLGDMVLERVWLPLRGPVPSTGVDYAWPSRPLVGPWPTMWSMAPSLADGTIVVEFYPISAETETVWYVNWPKPPDLQLDDVIPQPIDGGVLVEGALINAMRYNAARAANAGNIEAAGYWRNEYRAQHLSWERRMMDAIRADRGVDDLTIILQIQNAYTGIPQDILSARDHVWYGWRP